MTLTIEKEIYEILNDLKQSGRTLCLYKQIDEETLFQTNNKCERCSGYNLCCSDYVQYQQTQTNCKEENKLKW